MSDGLVRRAGRDPRVPPRHVPDRASSWPGPGGHDVLAEGSGNPGASNVARLMGWKAGLLVMAGDLAKGAIAAGVGLAVGGPGCRATSSGSSP